MHIRLLRGYELFCLIISIVIFSNGCIGQNVLSPITLDKLKEISDDMLSRDGKILVQAGGATFPNRFYQDALFGYQFVNNNVEASYISIGSGQGKCRIMNYETKCKTPFNTVGGTDTFSPIYLDFAGSDSILSANDYINYPDLQMYPAVAGAVVPIFNIPNYPLNEELILTKEILARIFRKCINNNERINGNCGTNKNDITRWNDTDIINLQNEFGASANAINALLEAGNLGEIKVIVREDTSGTTEIFRDALSSFDEDFRTQVGPGSDSTWRNVDIIKAPGNEGASSYILQNPGSISYSVLGEALQLGLRYAAMKSGTGSYVIATSETVTFTALELGMQFGNNDDDPDHLTALLINSQGFNTWPICGYSYFILRKNTLRPGATCKTRRATLDFLTWIYTSPVAAQLASNHGFSALPSTVADYVLNIMRSQLRCPDTNEYVYIPQIDKRETVLLYGADELGPDVVNLFASTYSKTVNQNSSIEFKGYPSIENGVSSPMDSDITSFIPFSLLKESISGENVDRNYVVLPYAGIAFTVITNMCGISVDQCLNNDLINVKLTPTMLSKILMKEVLYWNETGDSSLPHQKIKVLLGPTKNSLFSEFSQIMSSFNSKWNFEYVVEKADRKYQTNDITIAAVRHAPYSIAVVPLIGNSFDFETLVIIEILNTMSTKYLVPSEATVSACVSENSWDPSVGMLSLVQTKSEDCYPLVVSLAIKSKMEYKNDYERAHATVKFLEWLLSDSTGEPLVAQRISPLWLASINIQGIPLKDYIRNQLFLISNNGVSILAIPQDYNLLPDWLIVLSNILWISGVLTCAAFAIWMHKNQYKRAVMYSSPPFMYQILFGAALATTAIFPLSLQDGGLVVSSQATLDAACVATPFLFSMGSCIMHAALWLKTWRIKKLFNNPRMITMFIKNDKLLVYEAIILSFVLLINILWIALDPLTWKRVAISPTESVGYCDSENYQPYLISLTLVIVVSLIYGNYLAYGVRNVPDAFAEGKWIAISLAMMLEAMVLGIPIILISSANTVTSFLVKMTCILVMMLGTVLLIFVPKVINTDPRENSKVRLGSERGKTPRGSSISKGKRNSGQKASFKTPKSPSNSSSGIESKRKSTKEKGAGNDKKDSTSNSQNSSFEPKREKSANIIQEKDSPINFDVANV